MGAHFAPATLAPAVEFLRVNDARGTYTSPHEHDCAELLWSPSGAISVGTERGTWVAGGGIAVWLPKGTLHDVFASSGVCLHGSFVDAETARGLPETACAVRLTPELRAALLERSRDNGAETRPPPALLAELRDAGIRPLPIALSRPSSVEPLVIALRQRPASPCSYRLWASELGMSPRTLARRFHSEMGVTLGRFRRLMCLRHGAERLALGDDVTRAAASAGYKSVSMFVAMFRRTVGTTPGRYFTPNLAGRLERATQSSSHSHT